ncbi:MAG TPA: histidine phosphatase family protein [Longimicrobium sp.]|jgi:phosphohistidine phosphatase SixA|nr:histidine phosphatase family protein [Longimicrobium sp.]
MIRRFQALALAALLALPSAAAAQRATTVILVRHAEKVTTDPRDPNPGLTAAGEQRARDLARLLRRRHVAAVVTSQFARTKLTGRPTAEAAHLTPDTVPAGRDVQAHAAAVAELIRTRYAGKTVLVVGHSNTVPKIIAALGGPALGDLCDSAYSNLFTLVIPPRGAPRLAHTHYGASDPPGGHDCVSGIVAAHPAAPR